MTPQLYTIDDVAKRFAFSRATVYDWIKELRTAHPDIEWYVKMGRDLRFTEKHIKQIYEAKTCPSSSLNPVNAKEINSTFYAGASMAGQSKSQRARQTKRTLKSLREDMKNGPKLSLVQGEKPSK